MGTDESGEREPRKGQDLGGLDSYDGRYELSARRSDSSLPNMRRSTFSEALNKFSTITRRKTSSGDDLPTLNSMNQRSRIPTPGGVPRSTSFFTSRFSSKTPTQAESDGKKDRKFSARLVQSKSWLQEYIVSAPVTPLGPVLVERRRESSVKITQHKLMAPIPPPIPQSKRLSLVGNPTTPSSSPGYLRSTSSSQAKRRERVVSSDKHSSASKTPTSNERRQLAAGGRKRADEIKRYFRPSSEINRPSNNIPTASVHSRQPVLANPMQSPVSMTPISPKSRNRLSPIDENGLLSNTQVSAQTPKAKGTPTSSKAPTTQEACSRTDTPRVREQRTARYYYEATSEPGAVKHGCSDLPMLRPITSGRITQIRRIEKTIPASASNQSSLTFAQRAPIQIYGFNDEYVTMMPSTALDHLLESYTAAIPPSPDSPDSYGSERTRVGTPTPTALDDACPIDGPMADQWWLGRVFALADHFKTEELDKPAQRMTPEPSITGGIQADSIRPKRSMLDDSLRNRRVFIYLKALCTTDEARESLKGFKRRFDNRLEKEGEWERGGSSPPKKDDKGKGKESAKGLDVQEGEIKGKLSVLEKLKLRKNRAFKKSVTQGSASTAGSGA